MMDQEFPNNSIKQITQIGDENWLMCPSCIDAWEDSDSIKTMVFVQYASKYFITHATDLQSCRILYKAILRHNKGYTEFYILNIPVRIHASF
ncbi:MAG: hypothetical protein H0X29_00250 [Parachlamydiaceae bacterium]|nr:hypothetical protein [Parachlamydiaceae bacterium]